MTKKEIKIRAKEITSKIHEVVMENSRRGSRPWTPGSSKTLFSINDQADTIENIVQLAFDVVDSGGITRAEWKPRANKKKVTTKKDSPSYMPVSKKGGLFDENDDVGDNDY
jgi:hypothetical protein